LLHGDAGTGKTSTARAISNYAGWNYEETNASSSRSSDDIDLLAQEIRSVGENRTLFLIDESDSINGNSVRSLYNVLDSLPNPVIFTANEKWKVPDGIENRCKVHKFNLQQRSIKKFLKDVVDEEDIEISNRQLGQLATRNGIRDALNDLQEFVESNGKTDWDQRDIDDSPFAVTRRVILNEDYLGDMTPDDMVAFLNENIKDEFDGVEAMRSYQALSEADKWLGQVNRTQNYTWWRYAGSISEEVSNLRITEPYNDWVNVNYPSSRRNSRIKSTYDKPKSVLYKELRSSDSFDASFDFKEFLNVILPLLKEEDDETKYQLALSHSLSDKAIDALGISKSDFDDWSYSEYEDEEDSKDSIIETQDSGSDEEKKSLFDY